jgi:hypothetical protein
MVDSVKGSGLVSPPSTGWAGNTIRMECTPLSVYLHSLVCMCTVQPALTRSCSAASILLNIHKTLWHHQIHAQSAGVSLPCIDNRSLLMADAAASHAWYMYSMYCIHYTHSPRVVVYFSVYTSFKRVCSLSIFAASISLEINYSPLLYD